MCRWMGFLSVKGTSAYGPLAETDRSLWRLSFARKDQPQRDGWGLAWYAGPAPRVFRSAGPLPREKARLERAASRAQGRVLLAHVRRASNPRGLPLSRLRGTRNVQPFSDGRWTFAHNGAIPYPDAVAARLGPWRGRVRGLNDSEALFWLLRGHLKRTGSVPRAIGAVRRELAEVAREENAKRAGPPRDPHRGLNILLSDGERLWAYAEAPRGSTGGALADPRPYFQAAFLPAGDRLWAASEPLWSRGRWRPLRSGELLEARRAGDRVLWTKRKIF